VIPDDVRITYAQIVDFLTDTFEPKQLIAYIDAQRNKPLGTKVLRLDLPNGVSGCALGLADADIIGIRKDIKADVYWYMFGHEASHFLLKHVPLLSAGTNTATFKEFMRSRDIRYAMLRDRVNHKRDPREKSAEKLGQMIEDCIERYNLSIPEAYSVYFSLE